MQTNTKKQIVKKILGFVLAFIIAFELLTLQNISKANSSSSLYLDKVKYNIQVNNDGSMNVEEIWNIDIENTNTLFKQFKIDSSKYSSITDGSVSIIKNGIESPMTKIDEYEYHVPNGQYYFLNRGDNYEVAWGTGLENDSGRREYAIRYKVNGAIAKYNDCAELYWQVFGSNCSIPIKQLNGTITLPSGLQNTSNIKVWGHTPDMNGNINIKDEKTINFDVEDNKAEKMVEIRVAMPTEIINSSERTYNKNELDNIISEETQWANEANTKRTTKIITISAICILFFALLLWIFIKNIHILRTVPKMKPTETYDYFRDLPDQTATPGEARFIVENEYDVFKTTDIGKVIMATILDLSLRKVIEIEKISNERGKTNFKIKILKDSTGLPEDEKSVYRLIKKTVNGDNETSIKEIKDYIIAKETSVASLKTELDGTIPDQLIAKEILSADGIKKKSSLWYNVILTVILFVLIYLFFSSPTLFTNIKDTIGLSYSLMGIILLFIIIDKIVGKLAEIRISAYTQKGIDEQEKWTAFKKYMEDFSLLKDREVPELALWEKYLVYATAFGIADKVIKQLKIVYPEFTSTDFLNTYVYYSIISDSNFYNSLNSISSATSTAFSSASGNGGGFSVGGGGGGGGGGCGGR